MKKRGNVHSHLICFCITYIKNNVTKLDEECMDMCMLNSSLHWLYSWLPLSWTCHSNKLCWSLFTHVLTPAICLTFMMNHVNFSRSFTNFQLKLVNMDPIHSGLRSVLCNGTFTAKWSAKPLVDALDIPRTDYKHGRCIHGLSLVTKSFSARLQWMLSKRCYTGRATCKSVKTCLLAVWKRGQPPPPPTTTYIKGLSTVIWYQPLDSMGCFYSFTLFSVNISDLDECQSLGKHCQHYCRNTPGSYVCECYDGFQMKPDQISCKCRYKFRLLYSVSGM